MSYYFEQSVAIGKLTSTPEKREYLNDLQTSEKLELLYKMTDSKNIVEVLDFIRCAYNDADYCSSYR